MDPLPRELIQLVISFADAKAKRNLRQTCTSFFNIINQSKFTLYFTRSSMMPAIVETFSRYNKPLSLTFTKTINLTPRAINHLSSLTNLVDLYFDTYFYGDTEVAEMSDLTRLTNLNSLQFSDSYHASNYPLLVSSLTNLTRLRLENIDTRQALAIAKSNSKLLDASFDQLDSYEEFANIGNLTSLRVTKPSVLKNSDIEVFQMAQKLQQLTITLMPTSLALPFDALTALTSLTMCGIAETDHLNGIGNLNHLEELSYYGYLSPNMTRHLTSLTHLKKLQTEPVLADDSFIEALQFMPSLSGLLDCTIGNSAGVSFNSCALLPNNLTSLKMSVTVENGLDALTRLTALQQLEIPQVKNVLVDYQPLKSLTLLTRLIIRPFSASHDIFTCVSRLSKLKILVIDSRESIPDHLIFDLSNLPNLERLHLPSITSDALQTLSTSNMTFMDAISPLPLVFSILERLPLKILEAKDLQQKEWQRLIQLTTLESLFVSDVPSDDNIISLTALSRLTQLGVFSSPNLSHKCFTCLTSLQRLHFSPSNEPNCSTELIEQLPHLYYCEIGSK